MLSTDWDAVVVGAGPAGALAARSLAQRGLSVLLAERRTFPRAKVCGGCLNAKGVAILEEVGLGELLRELAAPALHALALSAGGRHAALPLSGGAAVDRATLDQALAREAVAAGATFVPGCQLLAGPVEPERRLLISRTDDGDREISARVVVAADGLGSALLPSEAVPTPGSRLGAGAVFESETTSCEPGVVTMAVGSGGYVGLVRLGDGRLNAAAAFDARSVRAAGGLGPAADSVLAEAGAAPVAGLADADWSGTPPLTRRPQAPAAERLFAVGDASGYVEPFTGEGMAWALADALAVAELADAAASRWHRSLEADWSRRHRERTRRARLRCRAIALTLRSPATCSVLLRLLGGRPGLGRRLAAGIHGVGARG